MTASSLTAALLLAGNEGGLSVVHNKCRMQRGRFAGGRKTSDHNISFPDDKPGSLARPVHLGDAVDSVDTLLSSVEC